jgi:serine/threonine-protein kinase
MSLDTQVADLLLRWEELREQGRAVPAEELCADCPELLGELRRQLEALRSLEGFLDTTGGGVPRGASDVNGGSAGRAEPLPGSRYRPLRLHAQGGLGEVYVARDEELSREVALKRMRRPHAGEGARRRFLREGEITGSLEHPGVVPVYGLTRDAQGQPCYAMRLVRGQSLQEAIARFHAPDAAGGAARGGLALRQLLGRFLVVCNTIAYAHSRGVVHRDLKPANIMLGDYGETLVVDWGLAKRVGGADEEQPADGDGLPHGPGAPGENGTAAGEVLGTPAYMSPEQAAGRNEEVGPASDIYGLGATLYALLTGRPPFAGAYVSDGPQTGERGAFMPPRQLRPDTPPALEAICLKAMAREPSRRYVTVLELAADLERWLADEPVCAFREPLTARLRRWVRRHRTLVTAICAVLGVSALLGGGAAGWLAARQAESNRTVRADLDEATRLQWEEKWAEAGAAVQRAEVRLGKGGPDDLRRRAAQVRSDLRMVVRLDKVRLDRIAISDETLQFDSSTAAASYADAFRDYGLDVGADPESVATAVREAPIKGTLLAALDDWAEQTPDARLRARLIAVACRADPDPWRDRFRELGLRLNDPALGRLAAEAPLDTLPLAGVEALVRRLWRADANSLELARRAQARHPSDYFLNIYLAAELQLRGWRARPGEAVHLREEGIGFARAAIAARPDSSMAWAQLGALLFDQGRYEESEAAHRRAIVLQPENALPYMLLSAPLRAQGRVEAAEQSARTAIALNPGHGLAYSMLASALLLRGKFPEAEAAARTAIRLQSGHAFAYVHLASALRTRRKYREAADAEEQAVKLRPGIVSDDDVAAGREMARLEGKLPEWLQGKASPADARELAILAFMASHYETRFAAAAELCAKSFADRPDFAEATVNWLSDRPRYYAACCAARASARDGDAADLPLEARGRWRRQALTWLRQELTSWDKQLAGGLPAARARATGALLTWQTDGWLAAVRDPPDAVHWPAAERDACRKLWADVARLLQRAQADTAGAKSGKPGP